MPSSADRQPRVIVGRALVGVLLRVEAVAGVLPQRQHGALGRRALVVDDLAAHHQRLADLALPQVAAVRQLGRALDDGTAPAPTTACRWSAAFTMSTSEETPSRSENRMYSLRLSSVNFIARVSASIAAPHSACVTLFSRTKLCRWPARLTSSSRVRAEGAFLAYSAKALVMVVGRQIAHQRLALQSRAS